LLERIAKLIYALLQDALKMVSVPRLI